MRAKLVGKNSIQFTMTERQAGRLLKAYSFIEGQLYLEESEGFHVFLETLKAFRNSFLQARREKL